MAATKATPLNKRALFRDLGYKPHPGQLEVHMSRAPRRILACGVRWGKTLCGAMEAVAALMQPCDESMGWIVAPTFDLCDQVLKHIHRVLLQYLPHRIESVDLRNHRIAIRNLSGGLSEVRARSADNPVSLLGEGLDWMIVDEAARLEADIWESHLSQRLVDRDGWALLASTPRGGGGWFHHLFLRGQGRDSAFASWSHPTWANPLISPEVVERERERLPEATFRQEYGGEFVGDFILRCDVCGAPRPEAEGHLVLWGDEKLERCVKCGEPVDCQGRAHRKLHPSGHTSLRIVRVHGPLEHPPALPTFDDVS